MYKCFFLYQYHTYHTFQTRKIANYDNFNGFTYVRRLGVFYVLVCTYQWKVITVISFPIVFPICLFPSYNLPICIYEETYMSYMLLPLFYADSLAHSMPLSYILGTLPTLYCTVLQMNVCILPDVLCAKRY